MSTAVEAHRPPEAHAGGAGGSSPSSSSPWRRRSPRSCCGGRGRPRSRWRRSAARTSRPRSPPTARSRPRGRWTSRPPIAGQITQLAVQGRRPGQEGPVPAADRRGRTPAPRPAAASSRCRRCCASWTRRAPTCDQAQADLRARRGRTTRRGIIPEAELRAGAHRAWPPPRPPSSAAEQPRRAGARDARGRAATRCPRPTVRSPDGRHRDRQAGRGGRGRGHRRPEPARARCC